MPRKVRQVFTNFSAGELNPLLNARTDAKAYFEGARQCKNWYLLDEGGVMRRPATQFTAELPAESRIIPFIFAEDEVAIVESVKAASDVYSPVSGKIIEVNELLLDNPEIINESPYSDGWFYKIQPDNLDEINELLSPQEYGEVCEE